MIRVVPTATRLVIIGGGGHARSVIECITTRGLHRIIGIAEVDPSRIGQHVDGVEIICDDAHLDRLGGDDDIGFVMGVGGNRDNRPRQEIFNRALAQGLRPITLVHPAAWVAGNAQVGLGTVILAGAIVNPGAVVGDNVILNTGCIVEHDCRVGDHAHISTRAALSGSVAVGRLAHVGAGAVIRQGLNVGYGAVVGIGAVVTKNVEEGSVVAGNPARPIK